MRLGKWVPVYRNFIPIPQSMAMAFGLTEGSLLHLAPIRQNGDRHSFHVEIIVSPIPIQGWRSACRLSVRLKNTPRALANATGFLRKRRINILLTEACATYRNRAHWDAICDVSQCSEFSDLSLPQRFFEQGMKDFLDNLTNDINSHIEAAENREFFLTGPEQHAVFSALTGLNDASFGCDLSHSDEVMCKVGGIEFSESLINVVSAVCKTGPHALPEYAMITGNTEQRYLRMYFIHDYENMFQATVKNELRGLSGDGIGILHQFLNALPVEINLLKLSNHIEEKKPGYERGRIDVIGHWEMEPVSPDRADRTAHLQRMEAKITDLVKSIEIEDVDGTKHGQLLEVTEFSSPELTYPRVFISYSTRRAERELQAVISALWQHNWEPILGTDFGQAFLSDDPGILGSPDVVQTSFRSIDGCIAFVSLQTKRDDFCIVDEEQLNRRYVLPPWAVAEEVYAWSSKIPFLARLKDRAIEDPRYNRHASVFEFQNDLEFLEQVKRLLDELNKFRMSHEYARILRKVRQAQKREQYYPAV